jgi:hypothetical protein
MYRKPGGSGRNGSHSYFNEEELRGPALANAEREDDYGGYASLI